MRIAYLIVAFSVFDVTAFAFSRSKVEHVMSQSSCRRQHIIGATLHQSARLNESSTEGLPVNLKVLKNKYDAPKRDSEEKSVVNFRTMLLAIVLALTIGGPAFADEYGVEKEAPTLFTGETVEICTKRGPLGACLKTEMRTTENDNDVSKKYFRDPSTIIQQQKVAVLQKSDQDSDDGNALIQKLRQQSVDNREKNDLYVARKTFEADQSATFGPFDRQVLIMNTDGKTYTLLENPVAMRLKKAGFIDDRRSFITQPSQEDLDAASEKEPGFFSNFLGGGSN